MIRAMAVCPSCGADDAKEGAACPACGYVLKVRKDIALDIELDIPAPPPPKPKPVAPKKKIEEPTIDFAVDLSSIRPEAPPVPPPPISDRTPPPNSGIEVVHAPVAAANAPARPNAVSKPPLALDAELEARTLANFGASPSNFFVAPMYAYRVWKRRNELRVALAARRDEASQAARAQEDAMCALGERVRPIAGKDPQATRSLQLLKDGEDLLRTRDTTLAREQDQHRERSRANDQRIAAIEAELVSAKSEERAANQDLADAQAAVQRAEAKLKRAEIELRSLATAQAARKTGA
jgi:hypothetical protein